MKWTVICAWRWYLAYSGVSNMNSIFFCRKSLSCVKITQSELAIVGRYQSGDPWGGDGSLEIFWAVAGDV